MSKTNPYVASRAEPSELHGQTVSSSTRFTVVLASTVVACVVAYLIGYHVAVRMDSIAPALFAIGLTPAAGAFVGGVGDPRQLLKIAAYGIVAWLLAYAFRPAVARATLTDTPDLDAQWIAFAFIPASVLAVIGAGFACRTRWR